MNKTDFTYYINHPNEIDAQTAEQINHLMLEYPWSQPLRALYLKHIKENDKPAYQKHLSLTAAYTAQRGILYEWLNQQNSVNDKEKNTQLVIIEQPEKKKKKKKDKDKKKKKKKLKFKQNQQEISEVKSLEKEDFNKEKLDFFTWIKKLQDQKEVKKENKQDRLPARVRKMKIIDEFLKKSPKIKPKHMEEDISAQPPVEVNENRFLMTETLAKLLWKQEKYDKAIQAYEILILKYPEKSRYFASQIEEIKKQKENKKINR